MTLFTLSQRKKLFLPLGSFLLGALIVFSVQKVLADNSTIYACVRTTTLNGAPNVRIIDASQHCNSNETALSWNQQGQPGPQGPTGPQGPAGNGGNDTFALRPFICSYSNLSPYASSLIGKDFSNSELNTCSFTNIDLTGIILKGSYLINGDFSNSNLSNADLSNLPFTQGSGGSFGTFVNSNLANANFSNDTWASDFGSDFSSSNLQQTNFTNDHFNSVNFTGATNMNTSNLTGTIWFNTICPDGTNSDTDGNTCVNNLTP